MNGACFSSRVRSQEGRTRKANARKTWKSELEPLLTNVVENAGLLLRGDFDLLLELLLILSLQPRKVPLLHLLYSSITSSKGSFCKLSDIQAKISTTSKNVTAFSYLAVLVDIAFLISGASPFTWYCGELFLLIL